ncbi:MAG: S8 family peptidase, partial [Candidatus Nitrosotenuis sp.]
MKSAPLLAILTAVLVISSIITIIPAEAKQEGKRVLAFSEKEANDAVAKGCKIVREVKNITALVCNPLVSDALGLQEDIEMFAVDSGANTQIGATTVWSTNTGANTRIAILDTGYNYNHSQLSDSYDGGYDFVNNDIYPLDDNGHGTHVAGLITSNGNSPYANSKGVAPAAKIISGKVLGANGSGSFSDILAAIYWAADYSQKVDAISMSLGSSKTFKTTCDSYYPAMKDAIDYAIGKGIVVVIAAGNSGNAGVSFPGCVSTALTVGA